MKYLIIGILLLPIFFWAFQHKKWYLYLTFALYGILPDACAFEISTSLPLITVSRILIVILMIAVLSKKGRGISLSLPKTIVVYIISNIIISCVNLSYGIKEVNWIFILIFEQFLLVVLVYNLIDTGAEFYKCLDFMIAGCIVLAVIGVLQSIFDYDVATVLNWVTPRGVVKIENRMGMTRAYATFNALSYGCYCSFMSLLIWHRYEISKKHIYIVAFLINFLALLFTMSRSSLLSFGIIISVLILHKKKKFVMPFFRYIPLCLIGIIFILLIYPSILHALSETIKSIFNTLGLNFELSSEFGSNAFNGSYSRMRQWSVIIPMLMEGAFLFGYGYNGFENGLAHYYNFKLNQWHVAKELDVGFVAFLISSGLIGLISYIWLLIYIFITALKKERNHKSKSFYNITLYVIPMLFFLEFTSSFSVRHLEWLYFSLFFVYFKKIDRSSEYEFS